MQSKWNATVCNGMQLIEWRAMECQRRVAKEFNEDVLNAWICMGKFWNALDGIGMHVFNCTCLGSLQRSKATGDNETTKRYEKRTDD